MTDPRIAFFDNLSAGWDHEEPLQRTMSDRLEQLGEILGLAGGMDILEVGCGTGKLTSWLARRVAPGSVTAVDFAPEMIRKAKEKKIAAEFHCLDICSNDIARTFLRNSKNSKKFDLIFCFHCFPHFRNQSAALRNLAGVIKPSARLIVMHLAGSEHINNFHANLAGPVGEDTLPVGEAWGPLLSRAGLKKGIHIDREDLFFLEASCEA